MSEEELKNQTSREQLELEFEFVIESIKKTQKILKQLSIMILKAWIQKILEQLIDLRSHSQNKKNQKMQEILEQLNKSTEFLMKHLNNLISQSQD